MIVTSSLTAGAYFPILKSDLLILVVALAPHASFLLKGCGMQTKLVTVNETGLLTPFSVKIPSTPTSFSPSNLKFELRGHAAWISSSTVSVLMPAGWLDGL